MLAEKLVEAVPVVAWYEGSISLTMRQRENLMEGSEEPEKNTDVVRASIASHAMTERNLVIYTRLSRPTYVLESH